MCCRTAHKKPLVAEKRRGWGEKGRRRRKYKYTYSLARRNVAVDVFKAGSAFQTHNL